MTPEQLNEARAVAGKLTTAQRKAVLWLSTADRPIQAFRRTFSPVAAFNLVGPGVMKLTTAIPPGEREYRDHYSLTPFGHAVATILQEHPNG